MVVFFSFMLYLAALPIADYLQQVFEREKKFRFCDSNYEDLVEECKKDQVTLKWVFTLDKKFKKFIESKDYVSSAPYEEFEFDVPTEKGRIRRIRAQIIIDRKRNLKLAINNYGFTKCMGIVYFDKYLSNCVGLNNDGSDNGLTELINSCKKAAFDDGIVKVRKENIEKLINQ